MSDVIRCVAVSNSGRTCKGPVSQIRQQVLHLCIQHVMVHDEWAKLVGDTYAVIRILEGRKSSELAAVNIFEYMKKLEKDCIV